MSEEILPSVAIFSKHILRYGILHAWSGFSFCSCKQSDYNIFTLQPEGGDFFSNFRSAVWAVCSPCWTPVYGHQCMDTSVLLVWKSWRCPALRNAVHLFHAPPTIHASVQTISFIHLKQEFYNAREIVVHRKWNVPLVNVVPHWWWEIATSDRLFEAIRSRLALSPQLDVVPSQNEQKKIEWATI